MGNAQNISPAAVSALCHRVETRARPTQCANSWPVELHGSVLQGEVGGRDPPLLKHVVVEWSDAKETICCLAIKHHPHEDGAVANVKEIKATVNQPPAEVMINATWSTLHFQPAHSIWIYSPHWPFLCCSPQLVLEPAATGTGITLSQFCQIGKA